MRKIITILICVLGLSVSVFASDAVDDHSHKQSDPHDHSHTNKHDHAHTNNDAHSDAEKNRPNNTHNDEHADKHDHSDHDDHSHSQAPHVHGKGNMSVAIAHKVMNIELKIPAHSILGFEYKPKTNEEKNRLSEANAKLTDKDLFKFYSKKGMFKKEIEIPVSLTSKQANVIYDNGHAEYLIQLEYSIQSNEPITAISTQLFEWFEQVNTLRVGAISSNGISSKKWKRTKAKVKL